MVYVQSKEGLPLMPTRRHGKVRRMLKNGRARVVRAKPFTIQLTYKTTTHTQPGTLGLDSGYLNAGFSVVNEKTELISGECELLGGQVERNRDRRIYRRQRRSRLRYRKPAGEDRYKPEGWLAPSLQNKLDTHIRLMNLSKLVPVKKTIVEVASFDIQAIKNPGIAGVEYQQGEQYGFWNVREYVLHRDGHKCQNPACKNKSKHPVLQVHHVGYWKGDYSDRPGNLVALCDKCHIPANHKQGKLLWGWEPILNSFRPETFMTVVRWKLVNALGCEHTYGHTTKSGRVKLGLEKSHANDAFVIAGGTGQARCKPLSIKQVRRNNRSLQKFYDAWYIDTRTGETAAGQELFCGRRTRNKNLNSENYHKYRGHKVKKGRVSIRRQRYPLQPWDTVLFAGKRYLVKGVQNRGAYIKLDGLAKPVKTSAVKLLYYGKGLCVL